MEPGMISILHKMLREDRTTILWAKYCAPNELDNVMGLNRKVLDWFDGMKSCIPNWYIKEIS